MDDLERKMRELGERTDDQLRHGEVPRSRIVRRVRLRRGAAAAGTFAVVALVAALTIPRLGEARGDDGFRGGVDFAAVAETTEDEGTARIAVEMVIDVSGTSSTTGGTGVIDFERVRSRLLTEETGLLGAERGEVVSIGGSTFQRVLGENGDDPTKWYETKRPAPGASALTFGMGSPSDFLSSLTTISDEVTDLGDEELDGVTVTHYRAEITFPYELPTETRFELEPMDVWIDEAGRLRRLTYGMTFTDAPAGARSAEVTMRLWDFGVPVDVVAPDPEDVVDEPPPGLGAGFGGSVSGEESSWDEGAITMIMGDERVDAPYVEVDTTDPSFIELCMLSPQPVTGATLVHDSSGRRVFVFEPLHSDGHVEGTVSVACVEEPVLPADVDAVVDDPTAFELIARGEDGSKEVVRLSFTASSLGGGDGGE